MKKGSILIISALIISAFFFTAFSQATIVEASPSNEISRGTGTLTGAIEVNGEIIQAPAPFIEEGSGAVMVPVREVAENLGLKVLWEEEEEKFIIGYGVQIWIGKNDYIVGFAGINTIKPAPVMAGGHAYVPLHFIENVLGYDAYLSDGTVIIGETIFPNVWIAPDNVNIWFSEDAPYDYSGGSETICVGKTPDGGDVFALVRMPLGADWLADEVTGARLFFKVADGTPPSEIYIGTVAKSWGNTLERQDVRSVVRENSFTLTEVTREDGGWVSMDVTDIVVNWLGSENPNRGFALYPSEEDALGVFVSGAFADVGDAPRIVVSAEAGERSSAYGKFGFTKQPGQGYIDPIVGGNCLSYSLRDNDGMLYFEDYNFDFDEMNRILAESGENGILEYLAAIIEDYVETHKEGLQISGFRRIEDFDSPIDPETEYRIVLRVSAKTPADIPMSDNGGFDYHLWAQLSDGRWTQKNPSVFSSIIPCTGPGISPLAFDWDAGDLWGVERYQEWYTSDGAFFAVTKDTDEFTKHRQQRNDASMHIPHPVRP